VIDVLIIVLAGAGTGCLGALFGIGGGLFLVPILQFVVGLPFATCAAVSQMTIVGTSVAVSCMTHNQKLANIRLAMTLQVLTLSGALLGGYLLGIMSPAFEERVFGGTAALIALMMLRRLHHRNVILDPTIDVGVFGGRLADADTQANVSYRLRRMPLALAASGGAGAISVLGVGGGVIIVPMLNAWCGIPLRVAAATSAFMLGATAIPGIVAHIELGHLTAPHLAAAAVLGVLGGSRLGVWLGPRVGVRSLKLVLIGILILVALKYLLFASAAHGGPR
jgi:uncharacterized membrane protein YfcA